MSILSFFSTLWIVFQILFGIAFFWGVGLLGYSIVSGGIILIHELSGSERPRFLPRLPSVWVSMAAAAVMTGLTFFVIHAFGVPLHELVDLVLPLGDVNALLEVPESTVLLEALKKDPTGFLLSQFTSGEAFCTSIGAAVILLVWDLLYHLLCDREDEYPVETWEDVVTGAAEIVISICATVVAFTFWNKVRPVLIWILTWGTGRYFPDYSSNVFLSILFMIYVIVVGSLMIGVVLKEIMENSVLCVILGFAVSRLFITPVFSGAGRIGYIALAVLLSAGFRFLYKWGYGKFLDDFDDYTPLTYCYNGAFFLISMSVSALFSWLYIRFLPI